MPTTLEAFNYHFERVMTEANFYALRHQQVLFTTLEAFSHHSRVDDGRGNSYAVRHQQALLITLEAFSYHFEVGDGRDQLLCPKESMSPANRSRGS